MKATPRPLDKMLRDRLSKYPVDQLPAKVFEYQVAEVLLRAGTIGLATALTAAERLCKNDPRRLAELLHRISSDYLNSTVTQENSL